MLTRNAAGRQAKGHLDAITSNAGIPTEDFLTQLETRLLRKIDDRLQQLEDRIMAKIDASLKSMDDRLAKCEKALIELQDSNSTAHKQMEDLRRVQRLSDIVIHGIPCLPNENVTATVKNIAAIIKHPLSSFSDAFRIKSRSPSKSQIVVRLASHCEQRAFLTAFRGCGGIQLSQLEGFSSTSPVYVNESLTPYNNSLLREALKLRRSGKIHTATTRNGLLHIRSENRGQLVRIASLEQLRSLFY